MHFQETHVERLIKIRCEGQLLGKVAIILFLIVLYDL